MSPEPLVYVVDDDEAVRRFLGELIASIGLRVEAYSSAQAFLDGYRPEFAGCLLLDIRMPGMSGIELQRELAKRASVLPIIVITGHGDVELAVEVMKAGAVDFIQKPFNNELLLDKVQKAATESVRLADAHRRSREVVQRIGLLTPRERQVLDLVIGGETNKGIARRLGIAERTVEIHRANVMDKMQAKSLADLVRMTVIFGDLGENP